MTGPHLITTPIKIGRCTRCSAFVFSCHVGGVRTAADPVPLDIDTYRQALIAGRPTYRVIEQSGRPWKLETDTAAWTSDQPRVAGHTCGASPLDAPTVDEVPEVPTSAPATRGGGRAGPRPPRALAGAQTATQSFPSPAGHANPRRSDTRSFRCATCGLDINPSGNVPHVAIEHGTDLIWAAHAQCP